MSSTSAHPVTDLRLARLGTWARLWLVRALGVLVDGPLWRLLASVAEGPVRANLRLVQAMLLNVITLRALRRAAQARSARKQGGFNALAKGRAGLWRAARGVRLRRLLRGRTLKDQIEATLRLAQAIDAEAARLAKRLARGIRRPSRFAIPVEILALRAFQPATLSRVDSS